MSGKVPVTVWRYGLVVLFHLSSSKKRFFEKMAYSSSCFFLIIKNYHQKKFAEWWVFRIGKLRPDILRVTTWFYLVCGPLNSCFKTFYQIWKVGMQGLWLKLTFEGELSGVRYFLADYYKRVPIRGQARWLWGSRRGQSRSRSNLGSRFLGVFGFQV